MRIILSLGTNMPDRLQNLIAARDEIAATPGCAVTTASYVYETDPVDVLPEHQDKPFLNAALLVETALPPDPFSNIMHDIEERHGRSRTAADRNAPRTIDIDLIAAEERVISTPHLKLPHPRWHERRFVVEPINDICPDLTIPGASGTVSEILAALPRTPAAHRFERQW